MFERCAVDLLRCVYPGLVPIRGGDDGGMDGAIADPRGGSPIPLVVTTAGSVIGNLTKNLESYRRDGGAASEAVLATSRPLSARQRRNLEKRAREFDFTLRQIHDQADFVGRLYRNPAWRRELLGVTGDPPALSAFPRSPRPWPTSELLGRDEELAWLRRAEGDVVVSGQPGVGKTALLGTLAKEGHGLFVVSADIGKIADALLELRPDRVFVDDAHLDSTGPRDSLLGTLNRLRLEPAMSFRIVATTWPGHEDDIRHRLFLPSERVLRVNALERAVMAEIIRSVNPQFTDVLVGEILDQSDGRPGLAVTLAQWAQGGALEDLVNGQLLLTELRTDVRLSDATLDALATFALGGQRGMTLAAAARVMEMSETHLREAVLPVSGTGVIHETVNDLVPTRAVSVKPAALRHALVQRTYFSGALGKSLKRAVDEVEDAVACTETLIGVLRRGGQVPHDTIRVRLRAHDEAGVGKQLWEDYAWTGEQAVGWILGRHPEKSGLVARAALRFTPDHALDQLISDVVRHRGDHDSLCALIRHWVLRGRPGTDTVARRRLLLQKLAQQPDVTSKGLHDRPGAVDWREPLAKLVLVAYALHFEDIDGDPITKERFNLILGSLPATDVRQLGHLWPEALTILRTLGDPGISVARKVVRHWCTGPRVLNELPETRQAAIGEAARMLPGVVDLADGAPGILLWAHRIGHAHGLRAVLPVIDDPLLPRLFPSRLELAPEERSERKLSARAREIARDWSDQDPALVIKRMLYCERQRQLSGHHYPNVLKFIPNQLSQHVDDPLKWLEALAGYDAPTEWVSSFLEAAVSVDPLSDAPWAVLGRRDWHTSASVHFGLSVAGLSGSAVDQIMAAVPAHTGSLTYLAWRQVPDEWKHRLLEHRNAGVRRATATGIWEAYRSKPEGAVGRLWQAAVVECGDAELLRETLLADPDVARAWVLHKARASAEITAEHPTHDPLPNKEISMRELAVEIVDGMNALDQVGLHEDLVWRACNRLTSDDRRDLILTIPPEANVMFFRHLVGGEPDLYEALLRRRLPEQARLAPLHQEPSRVREELIRLARTHGYRWCDLQASGLVGEQGSGG